MGKGVQGKCFNCGEKGHRKNECTAAKRPAPETKKKPKKGEFAGLNFPDDVGWRVMPIYEYYCEDCKDIFEAMQKITDKELTSKPGCGIKDCSVVKIISRTSFVLKGGWKGFPENSLSILIVETIVFE